MTTTTHSDPIKRAKARLRAQRIRAVKPPQLNTNEMAPGVAVRISPEELDRFERDMRKAKRPIHVSEVSKP